ncbi:MAG: DUF6544 family protein [Anaerocolumna sp.]
MIIVFFKSPYSKTKSEFNRLMNEKVSETAPENTVFTEEDIKTLPVPVQKYFRYCGYIGTPKMSYMKAVFKDVDFYIIRGDKKSRLNIDYTQYNYLKKPERYACIDSSMYGIPFEGFDSYQNGVGSMKGVFAKLITLFDQRGESMDKASLVTFLSESLIVPNAALQDYITWDAIDETHAKAAITYYGISASGIFTFDKNGAMISFRTKDRTSTDMDGTTREAEWSAICSDYQLLNGLRQPMILQAVWHYPEGDFLYFDGKNVEIEFR